MLAKRKMRSKDLASKVRISVQNMSLLKQGHVKQIRFATLAKICEIQACQPADILEVMPSDEWEHLDDPT